MIRRQSHFQTYAQCERRYVLEHVHRLRKNQKGMRRPNIMDIGSMWHACAAAYYKGEQFDVSDVCKEWSQEESSRLPEGEEPDVERDINAMHEWSEAVVLVSTLWDSYLTWLETEGEDGHLTPVLVEERIELSLGPVTLTGQLDLLAYNELTKDHGVIDHKVVARLGDFREDDFQALTYAVLANTYHDVSWAMQNQVKRNKRTARAKPPYHERPSIAVTNTQRANHWRLLMRMAREMYSLHEEHEGDYGPLPATIPNQSTECSWKCNVQDICKMVNDGEGVYVDFIERNYYQTEDDNANH